ncbi:hypothetical protein LMH81_29590, partial [Vibrio lentus]
FINNDHVNDAFSQLVNNSNANGPVGVDDNGLMSQLKPEDSLSGSDEELYSVDTQEEASFDLEDTPKDLETNNPDDSDLNDAMSFLTPQMQESAN